MQSHLSFPPLGLPVLKSQGLPGAGMGKHGCGMIDSACYHFFIIGTSQSNMHLSNWLIYSSLLGAEDFSVLKKKKKKKSQLGPSSFGNMKTRLDRSSKSFLQSFSRHTAATDLFNTRFRIPGVCQ